MRQLTRLRVPAALVLLVGTMLATTAASCPKEKAPILLGQAGLAVVNAIGEIQVATKQLTDAKILPPATALSVQEKLGALNDQVKPLPGLLRTIDAAQKAGNADLSTLERAIAVLEVVSADLSVVLGGVPVEATTVKVIALVREAQKTTTTILIEIAKLRGGA